MAESAAESIAQSIAPWAVLNPGGRDREQVAEGGRIPQPGQGHAPVNFHAYAFCTGGGFYREAERIPRSHRHVLVLLRRNGREALPAVRSLQRAGHVCWVACKEAGVEQVQEQLGRRGVAEGWRKVLQEAEGALSPTEHLLPLYEALGARRVAWVPTPYPVEYPEWDFGGEEKRAGVFLGTREFSVKARRHLVALRLAGVVAGRTGRALSLLDDGSCPGWLRRELQREIPQLEWIPSPLPYPDYLRLLARHEVVFQLDGSGVPGQVAGDCALARTLLVGGHGTNERILFPQTHGWGREFAELTGLLERALLDPGWRETQLTTMETSAGKQLSYATGARNLAALAAPLAGQVERVLGRDYLSKAARVEPSGSQSRLLQFTNPETNRPF